MPNPHHLPCRFHFTEGPRRYVAYGYDVPTDAYSVQDISDNRGPHLLYEGTIVREALAREAESRGESSIVSAKVADEMRAEGRW